MSWEQYRDLLDVAAQEVAALRDQEPTNCPNDGTALDTGPAGELHCPFDGWIWQGEPVTW